MSSSRSLSAADLLSLNVSIGWLEAVAIVQEIAERVSRGELAGVPELSDIAIDSHGAVLSSGAPRSSDSPVRALARLLQDLLGGSSPVAELGQLIAANLAEPPALGSVAEFQRALAFFERPGRQALLAELFELAAEARAAGEMHREVERLRAQQRDAEQPEDKSKRAPPKRQLAPLIITGGLTLVAAGGVVLWLYWPPHPGASGSAADARTGLVERTASRIAGAVKSLVSSEANEALAVETPEEPAKPSTPTRRRRPAAQRDAAPAPAKKPLAVPAPTPADLLPVRGPITTDAKASAPNPHVIFDATSADVAPPTMKRPQLPSRVVEASAPDTGMLELLVNEAGEVDKVKLVSPSNRFEDRMIVAAAKAWRFTPAEKDGRPVRYRLRVPLTW